VAYFFAAPNTPVINQSPAWAVDTPAALGFPASGGTYDFGAKASDPQPWDELRYSLLIKPATGYSIHETTGMLTVLNGAPSGPIRVRVTDSGFLTADHDCTVTVALAGTTPTVDELRAAGFEVLVSPYYNVDPSGQNDSTAGLQAAIDYAFNNYRSLYIPSGEYKIMDTIRLYSCDYWNSTKTDVSVDSRMHAIYGNSNDPPVLKLSLANALFQNTSSPRPVICERAFKINELDAGAVNAVRDALPSHPYAIPQYYLDSLGTGFGNRMRSVIVDTNHNPGAIGITWSTCQDAHMSFIKVIATDSFAGLHGTGGTQGAANIEVQGGQYGIYYRQINTAPVSSGTCVVGLKLYGQTNVPIAVDDYTPQVFVGCHIVKSESIAKIFDWTGNYTPYTNSGTAVMIDSVIETAGTGAAFPNPGHTMYLRNVYVKGTNNLVQTGAMAMVTAAGTWKCIDEYSVSNINGVANANATRYIYAESALNMAHRTVIDGTISPTYAGNQIYTVRQNLTAPDAVEMVSRHAAPMIPFIDNGAYCNVLDTAFAGGAKPFVYPNLSDPSKLFYQSKYQNVLYGDYLNLRGDGVNVPVDSWDAINAAIVEAARLGHNRVFMPRGIYYISKPINLKADTKLFGVGIEKTSICSVPSWLPTTGTVYIITTDSSAAGTACINDFGIRTRRIGGTSTPVANISGALLYSVDRFSHVHWRVGRRSTIFGVFTEWQYINPLWPTNSRQMYTFSGGGGGRHYFLTGVGRGAGQVDVRVLLINGTSEPLAFYGHNNEIAKEIWQEGWNPTAGVEVRGASNVRFYMSKREGRAATLWVNGNSAPCRNIALYGAGVQQGPPTTWDSLNGDNIFQVVSGDSDNILIAVSTVQKVSPNTAANPANSYQLREQVIGQASPLYVCHPEGLALYKRGTTNDSIMRFT